jgi:hypothetical protein
VQSYFGPGALVGLLLSGLRLDREAYRRVAVESEATYHCLAVTALAAVCQGALVAPRMGVSVAPIVVLAVVFGLLGLLLRAALLWAIGKAGLAHGPITLGTALRPLGLASAPALLYIFGAFLFAVGPRGRWVADWVLDPILGAWLLAASVVAIRSTLRGGLAAAILLAVLFRLAEREVGLLLSAR